MYARVCDSHRETPSSRGCVSEPCAARYESSVMWADRPREPSLCPVSLKGKRTNRLSLRFVDPELETRYSVEKEKQSGAAFSCSCVVLLFTAAMEVLIDPRWVHLNSRSFSHSLSLVPYVLCVLAVDRMIANYVTLAVGEVLLLVLTVCSLAAIFPRVSAPSPRSTITPCSTSNQRAASLSERATVNPQPNPNLS